MKKVTLVHLLVVAAFFFPCFFSRGSEPVKSPNILWFIVDDMSPQFSCYGETLIQTPQVDRLASEGTRFAKAFVTVPVCSPSRSALITGCYQTTIGAHNHRSGRGEIKIHLPKPIRPLPEIFHEAGYYTCIGGFNAQGKRLGKTDYNFVWNPSMYDGNDWSGRKKDQPFFMQVQLHGGKYRGQKADPRWRAKVLKDLGSVTSPGEVKLPPYYPNDPVLLQDWADYLDCCRYTDKEVGDVLARLEKEGLLQSTVIFFMTDHGISHARGKQFLYDEGIHVPLIIRGPGVPEKVVRQDLVEHIDLAATSLGLAGIPIPQWMQGRDLLAKNLPARDAVFSARDRCDETMEHIRSVRTKDTKYIRNYLPERPMLQPNAYKDEKSIVQKLRELHEKKQLNPLQERLLFSPQRPPEELYDLVADPYELHNLAAKPECRSTLEQMRKRLSDWEKATADKGINGEPTAMYDSDMAVYLHEMRNAPPEKIAILKKNLEWNRARAAEGK